MKLLWLGYLVYSLGNCVMKLCIETGLKHARNHCDLKFKGNKMDKPPLMHAIID